MSFSHKKIIESSCCDHHRNNIIVKNYTSKITKWIPASQFNYFDITEGSWLFQRELVNNLPIYYMNKTHIDLDNSYTINISFDPMTIGFKKAVVTSIQITYKILEEPLNSIFIKGYKNDFAIDNSIIPHSLIEIDNNIPINIGMHKATVNFQEENTTGYLNFVIEIDAPVNSELNLYGMYIEYKYLF